MRTLHAGGSYGRYFSLAFWFDFRSPADSDMQSNTSTTPSFTSPEQQQEVLRNLDSAAFASPSTSNVDFVSNNPSGSYGNATFVSPQNSTPWNPYCQHDFHQIVTRRGSLPLKKRRVAMLQEDDVYPASFRRMDESGFRSIDRHYEYTMAESRGNGTPMAVQQSSYGHYQLNPMNTTPFDKMNTLTLIAAAASVNEAVRSPNYTCQPHTVSFTSSLSSFDRVDQMRIPNTSFVTTGRDDSSSDDSSESERTTSSSDSAVDTSRVQPSRERHGRSSAVSNQKDFRASTIEASLHECPSSYSTNTGSGQDKRFTGLSPHQVRCHATTTRGRPCTYAAVQETKYCFLHADYEINPSPRRLKSSSDDDREMSSVSPAAMINTEDDVSEDEGPTSTSPAPSFESNANTESKMSASTVAVFKKRRTNAKFAEKHAESRRPLLSMMATDQWFGQSVEIAVGPFEGRTGIVQKWGNGWITVLIEGVGFHNRRSFELYLDTTNEDKKKNEKTKHGKKKKDLSDGKKKEQDRNLFRCVSRDVVSPSPTATNSANAKSRPNNGTGSAKKSRSVTPKLTPIVNSRNKKDGSNPKKLGVDATSFLETPLPQRISDGAETPIPLKSSLEGLTKVRMTLSLPTPKVTPFSEKTTTATRTLTTQDRCNVDLQFPGHSDDEAKQSIGIKSSDSALVFRPSMGERTRGRASSLTGSHHSSQSSVSSV